MSAPGIDWAGLMRLGLGGLRLPPAAFWAMTPGELTCALEGAGLIAAARPALGRAGLARLMAAFPDHPEGQDAPGVNQPSD